MSVIFSLLIPQSSLLLINPRFASEETEAPGDLILNNVQAFLTLKPKFLTIMTNYASESPWQFVENADFLDSTPQESD